MNASAAVPGCPGNSRRYAFRRIEAAKCCAGVYWGLASMLRNILGRDGHTITELSAALAPLRKPVTIFYPSKFSYR